MERRELTVAAEAAGCRLDKGLALLAPELSRSQIQTLAEKGSILKNGAAAGKKDTLREGDSIIISLPDPVPTGTQAENIPLEIVYEDDDLLVVNKPKGMVVHPAAGTGHAPRSPAVLGRIPDPPPPDGPYRPYAP